MFKRTRYQFGSVERKARKKSPDVWALRLGNICWMEPTATKASSLEPSSNMSPSLKPGGQHKHSCFGLT